MPQQRDFYENENPRPRSAASSAGGFVPLVDRIGVSSSRRMPDSLSAHSIRGRIKGQGLKHGGKGVLNDLVEELNEGICPEDEYSARSVLQTLHEDLAAGRQTIDFSVAKQQLMDAIDQLKATLPEKKEKRPRASSRRGQARPARSHQRPRRRF